MRGALILALALALLETTAIASSRYSVVFQPTDSMPLGFYFLDRSDRSAVHGSLVEVCPNDAARRYILSRALAKVGSCAGGIAPLLKIVLGVPGDDVRLNSDGVWINGVLQPQTRPVRSFTDADGSHVQLPSLPFGSYIVPDGEAWVYTPHWYSFDSRYFGPLRIVGTLHPLFTKPASTEQSFRNVEYR
jgi:conjugative transfer signal peptidase TraF